MTRRKRQVMGVHAPAPRPTWQVAALVALAIAVPLGLAMQAIWG